MLFTKRKHLYNNTVIACIQMIIKFTYSHITRVALKYLWHRNGLYNRTIQKRFGDSEGVIRSRRRTDNTMAIFFFKNAKRQTMVNKIQHR